MKTLALLIISFSTSAFAADFETCNSAVEKINAKKRFSLGGDGCNSYNGGYYAKTVLSSDQMSCVVELSFSYGGTQAQCNTSHFLRRIVDFRTDQKIKHLGRICSRAGLTQTSRIDSNTVICE